MKSVAAALVFTFSYSQLLWAADARQMLADAENSFLTMDDTRRPGGTTTTATPQENQAVVDQQNALQDLQNMNFSLTTKNGDVLNYVGNKLQTVLRPDGTLLNNIALDANGQIASADLKLADGSVQVYQGGQVIGYQTPDGTQVLYDGGRIQKTIAKDGTETDYTYAFDDQGNVSQTTLDNSSAMAVYDASGKIRSNFSKTDGSTTLYQDGIIQKILYADGTAQIFTMTPSGDDLKVQKDGGLSTSLAVSPFQYMLYRADHSLKEIGTNEGEVLSFDQKGVLSGAKDVAGNVVSFDFAKSSLGNVVGSVINQNGSTSTYDSQGRLSEIKLNGLTIDYKPGSTDIDKITKDDGTVMSNLAFDASGNVLDAEILTPDGGDRVYKDGKLFSFVNPDGSELFYFDDTLVKMVTSQKLTYDFNYTPDQIQASLDPSIVPQTDDTTIEMDYDASFNLKKEIKKNVEILNYLNNDLTEIDAPGKDPQTFTYTKDGSGKILSYVMTQGNVDTTYDAFNNPEKAVIHATADNPRELVVTYQYGKIRQITKDGALTFTYAYSFDTDGAEITTITDLEEKALKTYKAGLLLTDLSQDTNVLSTYSYDANQKVSGVVVTRFGKPLHSYAYAYSGDQTIVTDEEGVVRTYDAKQKLLYLDKDNQRFQYSYSTDADGQEIAAESLLQATLSDGSVVYYDPAHSANIQKVVRPDGSVITDIVLNADNTFKQATVTEASGVKKIFNNSTLVEEIDPDGSHLYFADNKISKVMTPAGEELDYSYEKDSDGNVLYAWVKKDNYDLKYDADGRLLGAKMEGVAYAVDNLAVFTDSSSFPKSISYLGGAKLSSSAAEFDRAGLVLNGAGDTLQAASNGDFNFGTGDWTIEGWFNWTTVQNSMIFNRGPNDFSVEYYNGALYISHPALDTTVRAFTPTAGTWYHIAFERADGYERIYINGVKQGGDVVDTHDISFTDAAYIGSYQGSNNFFAGKMDELRVSKGVARYGQNFTPPAAAFAPDDYTKLLLHFDGPDRSYYAFSAQTGLQGAVTAYSFAGDGGQITYDSAGNFLSATAASLYSADAGFKSALTSFGQAFAGNIGGFSTMPYLNFMNTTVSLAGGAAGQYRMGNLYKVSTGSSQAVYSQKIVNGQTFTVLDDGSRLFAYDQSGALQSVSLKGIPGYNDGSTAFVDASALSRTLTFQGDAKLLSSRAEFGRAGLILDGTADLVTAASSDDFNFGTGDFTVETFAKWDANKTGVFLSRNNAADYAFYFYQNSLYVAINNADVMIRSFTPALNQWYHIAFERQAGVLRIFVNGQELGPGNANTSNLTYQDPLVIGSYASYATDAFQGSLDEFRISKGIARYAGSFTPPTAAFTPDGYTKLLLHFDGLERSVFGLTTSKDSQRNVLNYSLQNDGGSLTFDAAGSLLTSRNNFTADAAFTASFGGLTTALTNKIGALSTLSYPSARAVLNQLNPDLAGWLATSQLSILDPTTVLVQEFTSSTGELETQTKADGTVTLFDDNKPSEVLAQDGTILIQYTYGADGNLSKVWLKNARETLPEQVLQAQQSIESQRASSLDALAKQKNLATQSIDSQVGPQRQALLAQLGSLQDEYNQVGGMKVSGKKAKNQRGDALNQIGQGMDQVRQALESLDSQTADAYAQLDTQVKALSDQIESDAKTALAQLAAQQANLQNEILKQEVTPLVYDYYRRILGRDPSAQECADWVSKIDYTTGQFLTGYTSQQVQTQVMKQSAAMHFGGNGDYLTSAASPDWNLGAAGSGDFTIDFWVKFNNIAIDNSIIGATNGGSSGWFLWYSTASGGTIRFENQGAAGNAVNFAAQTNTWYHWAVVRKASTVTVYVNGASVGTIIDRSWDNAGRALEIGQNLGGMAYFNGSIDNLRISKGLARWTANFTPPAQQYALDANTTLLLTYKNNAASFADSSATPHAIVAHGSPVLDATQSETQYQDTVTTTVRTPVYKDVGSALNDYLTALPELADRQAYVADIKAFIRQTITSYLAKSDADKLAFAQSLGLQAGDLIALSDSDAQRILSWLDSRNLHFGGSAFLSLEALLDQKGISYAREDIAEKAFLIDILTGIITPMDDGDPVISMFALKKVAALYGLVLSGASTTFQDLLNLYASSPNQKVVTLVNSSHFVVIQSVTKDTVTYLDTGAGTDKANDVVTVSAKDFQKIWSKQVLLEDSKVQQMVQNPNTQTSVLTDVAMQKLRGACLFIFAAIAWAITSIGVAIGTALAAIGAVLSAVGTIVGAVLSQIGAILGGILQGIGQAIYEGVHLAASTVLNAGRQLFGTFAQQSLFGGTQALAHASFGQILFQTAVKIGVGFAVSKGLTALGVNPTIADFAGNFITGGFTSGFNLGFSATNFVMGGLKAVAMSGTQTLLQKVGLDPQLAQVLSLVTSPLIDGIQAGNIGASLIKVVPNLAQSLSFYGIEKLGEAAGLDTQVASLIGAPISAGIGNEIGTDMGINMGKSVIDAVNQGLVSGAVSLGINYATQQAGLDPLLGSLTATAITGAISGALRVTQPNPYYDDSKPVGPDNEPTITPQDPFQGIYQAFTSSALNVARLGVSGTDSWSQAQLMQRTINFSDIVEKKGLAQAIDDAATQILDEDAINSILRSFPSVKAFIEDAINNNKFQTVEVNGQQMKQLTFGDNNKDAITTTNTYSDVTSLKLGNKIAEGALGEADALYGWTAGSLTNQVDGFTEFQKLENGQQTYAEVKDLSGKIIFIASPDKKGQYNAYNSYGEYASALINTPALDLETNLDQNEITLSNSSLPGLNVVTDVQIDANGQEHILSTNFTGDPTKIEILKEIAFGVDEANNQLSFGERFSLGIQSFNEFAFSLSSPASFEAGAGLINEVFSKLGITPDSVSNAIQNLKTSGAELENKLNNFLEQDQAKFGDWRILHVTQNLKLRLGAGEAAEFKLEDAPNTSNVGLDIFFGLKAALIVDGKFSDQVQVGGTIEGNYENIHANMDLYSDKNVFSSGAWTNDTQAAVGLSAMSIDSSGNVTLDFKFQPPGSFIGIEGSFDVKKISELMLQEVESEYAKVLEFITT